MFILGLRCFLIGVVVGIVGYKWHKEIAAGIVKAYNWAKTELKK